ncbi:MAG: hypothetical protein ACRES9_07015 [Gammaproteobacteria bacterium]
MKHPVRIVLKKEKTDANGQLMDAEYKTVDIDNKELESLLFNRNPPILGRYRVVGAELLNEDQLEESHRKESSFLSEDE